MPGYNGGAGGDDENNGGNQAGGGGGNGGGGGFGGDQNGGNYDPSTDNERVGPEGSVDDTRAHPGNPNAAQERDEIARERESAISTVGRFAVGTVAGFLGLSFKPELDLNVGQPVSPEVSWNAQWGPGTMVGSIVGAATGLPGGGLLGNWVDEQLGTQYDVGDTVAGLGVETVSNSVNGTGTNNSTNTNNTDIGNFDQGQNDGADNVYQNPLSQIANQINQTGTPASETATQQSGLLSSDDMAYLQEIVGLTPAERFSTSYYGSN